MKIFFLTDHFERYEQCGLIFINNNRSNASIFSLMVNLKILIL